METRATNITLGGAITVRFSWVSHRGGSEHFLVIILSLESILLALRKPSINVSGLMIQV